jgi:hypothetical protein
VLSCKLLRRVQFTVSIGTTSCANSEVKCRSLEIRKMTYGQAFRLDQIIVKVSVDFAGYCIRKQDFTAKP